mgnify:CR=1 FL=1
MEIEGKYLCKVAVIGCGFIGTKYIQCLSHLPFVKLQAVCDTQSSSPHILCGRYNITRLECDWRNIVWASDIDLVCVCVPNNLHYEIAKEAIINKKSVICEKPLGMTSSQSFELARLADKFNVKSHCAYNLIYLPAIQYAKKIIDSGIMGELVIFKGSYDNGRLADPNAPYEWRMQKVYSKGGAINDLAINILAISQFLLGDVQSVCGSTKIVYPKRREKDGVLKTVENDDVVHFLLKYRSGALGYVSSNRVSPGSLQNMQFEIQFSKGVIKYSLERMNEILVYRNGDVGFATVCSENGDWFNIGYDEVREKDLHKFIEDTLLGIDSIADFKFGAKIDGIVSSVLESSKSLRWVNVTNSI